MPCRPAAHTGAWLVAIEAAPALPPFFHAPLGAWPTSSKELAQTRRHPRNQCGALCHSPTCGLDAACWRPEGGPFWLKGAGSGDPVSSRLDEFSASSICPFLLRPWCAFGRIPGDAFISVDSFSMRPEFSGCGLPLLAVAGAAWACLIGLRLGRCCLPPSTTVDKLAFDALLA